MTRSPPRGLIANLVTPLDRKGRPEGRALERLVGRVRGEVSAVLVGSISVGEAFGFESPDRLAILEAALQGLGQGRSLFFEVTARTAAETAGLLAQAETDLERLKPRVEVFYLLTPLVYHSNRGLPEHLRELGRQTRRSFILSNNPDLMRQLPGTFRRKNIRTSVLKKIAANEQAVGLGFEGEFGRALNYQQALRARTHFRFYDGSEEKFMDQPSSSGLISSGAVLLPQAWADIVNSSLNLFDSERLYPDHLAQIWQSGRAVRALLALYRANPPAYLKRALELMGVIPRSLLAPGSQDLSPGQTRRLEAQLKDLHLI